MRSSSSIVILLCVVGCSSSDDVSDAAVIQDASVSDSSLDGSMNSDAEAGVKGDEPRASGLEEILTTLRSDPQAVTSLANTLGFPIAVETGTLVVSLDTSLSMVAGDFDNWEGTQMNVERDVAWAIVPLLRGGRYKFTDGTRYVADPFSRAYHYDDNGIMSQRMPEGAHLERFFSIGESASNESDSVKPRTVRVWVPAETPTHLLYCHDGQNLFNPSAAFGGWKLGAQTKPGLMFVMIDNTDERMNEYTHAVDQINGQSIGGGADGYAAFLQSTVRPLIQRHYGEAEKIGVMGSSLGGLVSLYIADRYQDDFDFVASLSGTLGWGSIGGSTIGETIIERYSAAGPRDTAIYLDSGGTAGCVDGDGDGIEDDGEDSDNYCVTRQMERALVDIGYRHNVDLWHWWEPQAGHNEAEWGARVFRPIDIFLGL